MRVLVQLPTYTRGVVKVGSLSVNVSDRMTLDQKAELYEILGQYPDLLCNEPGKTVSQPTLSTTVLGTLCTAGCRNGRVEGNRRPGDN